MNIRLIFFMLLCAQISFSQGRVLPISSLFKDMGFATGKSGSAVFPKEDTDIELYSFIQDSSKRFSIVGHYLYQRELIELKDESGKIWITPLFDLSAGIELQDSLPRRTQNTRGARLEGVLGKKVFFTTSFYENQAVLPNYASEYVLQRGEFYPNPADSSYSQVNAVIPGAARTKPFKVNGFDYAYATGMIRWNVNQKWAIYWGNQPLFVGSGHRSLLWSDNGVAAMNLRMSYRFSKKWDLQMVRARGLNLLRRPIAVNGEAYYEPKSLSFSTLYFHPTEQWSIGLFEGGVWNRGDSVHTTSISPSYFIPLPGNALLQEQLNKKAYSLLGVDLNWTGNKIVVYGQAALNFSTEKSVVFQAGTRLHVFKNKLSFLQLEYNHADKNAYQSSDPRIHYANYNLPIAHPAGNSFDELLIRMNYEMKHWFVHAQSVFYVNQSTDLKALLPIYQNQNFSNQQVFNLLIEAGYRFNRSYGFEVFGNFRYRFADRIGPNAETTIFNVGIRTALNNHYIDF